MFFFLVQRFVKLKIATLGDDWKTCDETCEAKSYYEPYKHIFNKHICQIGLLQYLGAKQITKINSSITI
jgi:hypothetical protein